MKVRKAEGGFTLVEIAIVLVIVGLLLGGALKGQELIQNAKIKRVKADFDQYVSALYSYQDRFRSLPGDDDDASAGGTAATTSNGLIDGGDWTTDAATPADGGEESGIFWEHLRAANLIAGSGSDLPENAYGGIVGIDYGIVGLATSHVICFSAINAEVAQIIDNSYDDNDGTTGSIRGTSGTATAVTDSATYAGNYGRNLCFEI